MSAGHVPALIEWLNAVNGFPIEVPPPAASMAGWRRRLRETGRVIVFGARGAGRRLQRWLHDQGIDVAFFLDNSPQGPCQGRPVYRPGEEPACDVPILIASTWFVTIGRQLHAMGYGRRHDWLLPIADILQLTGPFYDDLVGFPFAQAVAARFDDLKRVCDLLDDDASRQTLTRLVAYRCAFFQAHLLEPECLPCPPSQYRAAGDLDTLPASFSAGLRAAVAHHLANPSYGQAGFVWPQPGDVVIDGGAWEGDTAWWFGRFVQREGVIYAFEPGSASFDALRRNAAAMPARVVAVPAGLGRRPETVNWQELDYATPCNHVSPAGDRQVTLESLDRFITRAGLERVDYLKLDVEGSDFDALLGARETIRRFLPRIAVAVYHRPDHLTAIPLWLREQHPVYRLRIVHRHLSVTETVCLARPRR